MDFTCYSAFSITISENSPVFANRHNTGTVGIQVFAKVLTLKAFQFYRLGGTEDLTGQKRLKKTDKKSEHEMFDSLILFSVVPQLNGQESNTGGLLTARCF